MTVVDFKIMNQWKTGNKGLSSPTDIGDYILDINIDRRSGTNVNECRLNCDGIPMDKLLVRKSITNSSDVITDPMNRIQVIIQDEIEFTGWMINYKIDSNNQIVELTLHDNMILLKRGVNVHPRTKVTYENLYNTTLIIMLAGLVGVSVNIDSVVQQRATIVKEYTIDNGQNIFDAINSLCESLDAVIYADKQGNIKVTPSFIEYDSGYDFNYDDVNHITSGSTIINGSLLKPTIIVRNDSDSDHKKSWVFTDREMLEYLNDWDDVEEVSSDLAINQATAQNIAHQKLVLMWRNATSQDIMTADGNKYIDIDKVVQTTLDDNTDVYRVIGLNTTINDTEGYIDKLTLECIHPHNIEYLGNNVDCKAIRDSIVQQAYKYLNIPFHPDMYYRHDSDYDEWGMKDEALITHVLIDIGLKSSDQLTTTQYVIKNEWCDPITKDQLQPGDIVTWPNDQHEMGFYIGNNKIIEVWGSVLANMTPTAMQYCGYIVKVILLDEAFGVVNPECWRLKELKDCV
jgi:hypothetical protein